VTWNAIQRFKELNLHVRPHSMVVFLNDPLGTWDMGFIAELVFRDRTVQVWLDRKTPSEERIAQADYLIDYRDGRFVPVKHDLR
jgi:hypothetical protein